MTGVRKPSKESVRAWLRQRRAASEPPRDPGHIRDELGWHLMPAPNCKQPLHKETS